MMCMIFIQKRINPLFSLEIQKNKAAFDEFRARK